MITIANANALHIPLADQSVQCVVTSPPYYGRRDYGTAKWEGGDPNCTHEMIPDGGPKQLTNGGAVGHVHRDCKCGARRIDAQIGLEATPAAYVANIVAVMRECKRVLRDDGTLWLNLGDSYAGSGKGPTGYNGIGNQTNRQGFDSPSVVIPDGLKPKDLCGIPWRVAFALQADGWYLRSDIIWAKPNPMPESVTDRPTKAHEYVFLLTKRERYYYDAEAIKENRTSDHDAGTYRGGAYINNEMDNSTMGRRKSYGDKPADIESGRNRRSVWTVATLPYSGAHFATFPPALIEPMILAGSRRGDMVLDPFAGSGTTGAVAVKHGRRAVLLDLNTKYIYLQFERTNGVQITMPLETIAPNSPSSDVAR